MLKTPKWRTDNEHQVVSNGKGNHEVGSAGAQRGALGRPPKYSTFHMHGAKEKRKREWREYNYENKVAYRTPESEKSSSCVEPVLLRLSVPPGPSSPPVATLRAGASLLPGAPANA